MSYRHIGNLYKEQDIMLFKQTYAMEKIHGTSSHLSYNPEKKDDVGFFSGGSNYDLFCSLFNKDDLLTKFKEMALEHGHDSKITIYGEAYGGKLQGMSATYGKELRFIAFEVLVGEHTWLDVPTAEKIVNRLGLEFVPYEIVTTDIESLNAVRDKDSEVAVRRGMGTGHKREGVVLRPLMEVRKNNGDRIMAKHKRDDFRETKTPREVDPNKIKVVEEANSITEEWCTPMRLLHVLDNFKVEGELPGMEKIKDIIAAMVDDIMREGAGEVVDSKDARKAIGTRTVMLFKNMLKSKLE